MRILSSVVLSLFLLVAEQPLANAQSAEDFVPGLSWLQKNDDDRVLWVWGAIDGQSLLIEELGDEASKKLQSNRLPDEQLRGLVDVITQLYRDSSNIYIPWKYVAVVAAMKLNGKPQNSIDKRLESLRQYSTWLRKKRN